MMIKTAVITVPILKMDDDDSNMRSMDDDNSNMRSNVEVDLKSLLDDGYRIKIVNDVLYHDIMFAHYVLEKEC